MSCVQVISNWTIMPCQINTSQSLNLKKYTHWYLTLLGEICVVCFDYWQNTDHKFTTLLLGVFANVVLTPYEDGKKSFVIGFPEKSIILQSQAECVINLDGWAWHPIRLLTAPLTRYAATTEMWTKHRKQMECGQTSNSKTWIGLLEWANIGM